MENLSRSLVSAVACGLAGPAAGLAAAAAVQPYVADDLAHADGTLAESISATMAVVLVLGPVVVVAATLGTLLALLASRCPRPGLTLLAVAGLLPVWAALVLVAGSGSLGPVGFAVALGVVPGAVRLVVGQLVGPPVDQPRPSYAVTMAG